MPTGEKPLFRSETLRPKLSAFLPPPAAAAARGQLTNWANLLASPQANALKETELLGDFIADVFAHLLGYTGPAAGAERYTLKREATVEVDGKYAGTCLARLFSSCTVFATTAVAEKVRVF